MMKDRVTKALVRHLLEHPDSIEWTLQGFGMLRCYLEPEVRLHVWDDRYKAPGVSELHTHPWNFHSLVVAGEVHNHRFVESDGSREGTHQAIPRKRQTIRCGEGGGLVGDPVDVILSEEPTETYCEGEGYTQLAEEIHRSVPANGTVTIIEREFKPDTEHAYVYFQGEWGTAEPRLATPEEIEAILGNALETWFAEEEVAPSCP